MALSSQTVLKTLQRLKRPLKEAGKLLFIQCPDHAGGKEKTPSMLVTIDTASQFKMGSGHCFACGAHYKSWNDLYARLTGGDPSDAPTSNYEYVNVTKGVRKELLADNDNDEKAYRAGLDWDNSEWRSIPPHTMRQMGARYVMHPEWHTLMAFLPAFVKGELVGGVYANLKPRGKRNYFNTDGDWTHTTLFGLDPCKAWLQKKKWRTICIVEGPRDAYRFMSFGLPTVALLGTGHAGNEYKYNMLDTMPVENVILCMDGDDPGIAARKKAASILKGGYNVYRFLMESEDEDPGNMKIARVKKLQRQFLTLESRRIQMKKAA